jgi:3-oxoacyl-[acyl-carrier protein] reductase
MEMGLTGKGVVVTAASRGLGRAIAEAFAAEGANVLICSRTEADLIKTSGEIERRTGRTVQYTVADVAKKEDIDKLYAVAKETLGRLDVLITNAGGPPSGKFESMTEEMWENSFQTHLMSVVRLTKGALPLLQAAQGGRIVHIASSSVKQPIEGLVLSNTFRTGIQGLAKTLSIELAPYNILVNTIGPGRIATERTLSLDKHNAALLGKDVTEIEAESRKRIPLGRYGTPEEFAKSVVFLCSESNSFITGQTLLVDGGMVRAL